MKLKLFALLLCLCVVLPLCACAPADIEDGKTLQSEADMLNPLFRLSAIPEQVFPQTIYYATEDGFFYTSQTEIGYAGGFFVLPNIISNENIFQTDVKPDAFFDLGEEVAAAFVGRKLYWITLEAGSSTAYELGDKMQYTDILLGGDGAFYYETEQYLLTAELAFSKDYSSLEITERIVMPKDKINGFQKMLGVSEDGERLYYAFDQNGTTGFAYFGIGYKAEELGRNEIDFDDAIRVSDTKVLFTKQAQGRQVFTLADLDAGTKAELSIGSGTKYESFTVNKNATHLAAYLKKDADEETGGYLDLWSFEKGVREKHYELADLLINPSIALSYDANTIIVGQYDTGAGYEDDGGETVTCIEVKR